MDRKFFEIKTLFLTMAVSMTMAVQPLYGGMVVDRIVAIVNDEIISLYDLDRRVEPYIEKIKNSVSSPSEQTKLLQKVRADTLRMLIDEKLADQEIRRLKIKVGDAEVAREIERFKSVNQLSDEALKQGLVAEGVNLNEFQQQIKEQILRARLVNREIRSKIVVTKKEVADYYQAHLEEFGGEKRYTLKNILMVVPKGVDDAEVADVQNRLKQVYARLVAGEPFDALAREYSEATNAPEGGALGAIAKDALAPRIQRALEALEPGEFTDIIKTDQGYQIFYLENVQMGTAVPFEKAQPQIEEKLYNQVVNRQYEKWLQDLRKRSQIELIR